MLRKLKIDHNLIAQVEITNMACELKINIKLQAEMYNMTTHTRLFSVANVSRSSLPSLMWLHTGSVWL